MAKASAVNRNKKRIKLNKVYQFNLLETTMVRAR